MTRALGDSVMERAGVIPTPEVTKVSLKPLLQENGSVGFVVLATDGIFDVLTNEEVMEIIAEHEILPVSDACCSLVRQAQKKWQAGLPMDVRIDDATAVILKFRYCD